MRGASTTLYNYRQRSAAGGGRGRAVNYSEEEEEEEEETIRKGPWKAEEDEVLINHVSKYGPRDWSSIRSKGLLRRTGKSCRLRWVNKLRPNLKNGCKFSVEEERLVIEMQAQIGNKWARIATFLPGRTDNDVKNFWSSRQKRLARMRQASSLITPPPPSSDPPRHHTEDVPSLEVLECSLSMEEIGDGDSQCMFTQPPPQSTSLFSAYISHEPESFRMVELPALMNSDPLNVRARKDMTVASGGNPSEVDLIPFPLRTDQPEGQLLNEEVLVEPSFMDMFGQDGNDQLLVGVGGSDDGFFSNGEREMMFGEEATENGGLSCCDVVHENGDLKNPDMFFHDFPSDVFDQMESLDRIETLNPSPSKW